MFATIIISIIIFLAFGVVMQYVIPRKKKKSFCCELSDYCNKAKKKNKSGFSDSIDNIAKLKTYS